MGVITTSLNSKLKFRTGTARNARRISKEKWEEHRELLCSLYQEKTLLEIVALLQTEHGIAANAGQLGRKLRQWNAYKYTTKNRGLNAVRPSPDGSHVPRPGRVRSSEANLPDAPTDMSPKADTPALVLPQLDRTSTPGANATFLDAHKPRPSASTGLDVSSRLGDNSKTHPFNFLPGSTWASLIMVLQSYDDALDLVKRIERREAETGRAPCDRSLMRLKAILHLYRRTIQQQYESDLKHLGEAYACGDSLAQNEMKSVFIALYNIVLRSLQRALNDHAQFLCKFPYSALGKSTLDALTCLQRLSCRISAVAGNALPPERHLPHSMQHGASPEALTHPDKKLSTAAKLSDDPNPLNSAHSIRRQHGTSASTVQPVPAMIKQTEQEMPSDVDMDRQSTNSLAPSSMSGFESLRSLARRIKRGKSSLGRNSMDAEPSSFMSWNRSSSSLQLFGRLSKKSSAASSIRTSGSQMSWRPQTSDSVPEESDVRGPDGHPERSSANQGASLAAEKRKRPRPPTAVDGLVS